MTNHVLKIAKYEILDVLKSRWAILYALFFAVVTVALFRFGGGGSRVALSLMNIVLFVIPLVSTIYGTMYLYNARDFTTLLLSQPISRRSLFLGMYLGLSLPLALCFALGVLIPFLLFDGGKNAVVVSLVLLSGILLTLIFTAFAFWLTTRFDEKVKGFGVALALWLFLAIIYDGIVLAIAFAFSDYPLDKLMLALGMANPIDLARMTVLMKLDASALMGYTGAVFREFFGGAKGIVIAIVLMGVWTALPLVVAARSFARKDF